MNDLTELLMGNMESILAADSVGELTGLLENMGLELNEEQQRALAGKGMVALEDDDLDSVAGGVFGGANIGLQFIQALVKGSGDGKLGFSLPDIDLAALQKRLAELRQAGLDRFGQTAYARSEAVGGVAGYSQGSVYDCENGVLEAEKSLSSNKGYICAAHGTTVGGVVGSLRCMESAGDPTKRAESDDGMVKLEGASEYTSAEDLELARCVDYGDIYGLNTVGGVVGGAGTYTTIESCETSNKVYKQTQVDTYVVATRWNKPAPAGIAGISYGTIRFCANFATVASGTWSDEDERNMEKAAGYYAAGIAGFLSYYTTTEAPKTRTSPVSELYSCYNAGDIMAKDGMRQRGIVGENSGYTHDNLLLKDTVENDNAVYGDEDGEGEASGTVARNEVRTEEGLRASDALAFLNSTCDGFGWSTYWVRSGSTTVAGNRGFPMPKWKNPVKNPTDIAEGVPSLVRNASYDGGDAVPTLSVTLNGTTLVQNVDFFVLPQKNATEVTSSPAYTARISGIGKYTGEATRTCSYGIGKGSIATCDVVVETKTFNFDNQMPDKDTISLTCSGNDISDDDYEIEAVYNSKKEQVEQAVNRDIYTVVLKASETSEHFQGDDKLEGMYSIKAANLMTDVNYDNCTITWGDTTEHWLDSSKDEQYTQNKVPKTTLPYSAVAVCPSVTGEITCNGYPLVEGRDYRVIYGNPNSDDGSGESADASNAGKAGGTTVGCLTVRNIVSASGTANNFSSYSNMFFNIEDDGSTQSLDKANISAPDQIYDGAAWEPVVVGYGATTLSAGVDYSVSYENNIEKGTASYTVTGLGSAGGATRFTGTRTGTFEITGGERYALLYDYGEEGTAAVSGLEVYTSRDKVNISIPDTVEKDGKVYKVAAIADYAFGGTGVKMFSGSLANTSKLKVRKVAIGRNVKSIGEYAFGVSYANGSLGEGCVESVEFASGSQLSAIDKGAFSYCSKLSAFVFPQDVETIGERAFQGCTALKDATFLTASATLPSSVATGNALGSFSGCSEVVVHGRSAASAVRALAQANSSGKSGTNGGKLFTFSATDTPSANSISAKNFTKTGNTQKAQTFNLGAKATAGKLSYASNNSHVTVSAAGKVTIKKNFTGKATITIKAGPTDTYAAASKSITVNVKPGKMKLKKWRCTAERTMSATWTKQTGADKYQIRYKKAGAKSWTVRTLAGSKASCKLKKLTGGKYYYVGIRAYDSSTKAWGAWSASKKAKVAK